MSSKNQIVNFDFTAVVKKSPIIKKSFMNPVQHYDEQNEPLYYVTISINWSNQSLGYKTNWKVTVQQIDGVIKYDIKDIARLMFITLNHGRNKISKKIDDLPEHYVDENDIYDILTRDFVGSATSVTKKRFSYFKKVNFVKNLVYYFTFYRMDSFIACIKNDLKEIVYLTSNYNHPSVKEYLSMIHKQIDCFKRMFGPCSIMTPNDLLTTFPFLYEPWLICDRLIKSDVEEDDVNNKRQRID